MHYMWHAVIGLWLFVSIGGAGWIDVEESTRGIMNVLEDGRPLNGKFWSYSGDEIPW